MCRGPFGRWRMHIYLCSTRCSIVLLLCTALDIVSSCAALRNASILIRQQAVETVFHGEYAPGSPTTKTGHIIEAQNTPVRTNCSLVPNQKRFPDVTPRVGVVLVLLDDLGTGDLSAVNNSCFWTKITEETFNLLGAAVLVAISPLVELPDVPNTTYAVPLVFIAWDDGIRIGVLAVSDAQFSMVILEANSSDERTNVINNGDNTSPMRDNRVLHLFVLLASMLFLVLALAFVYCTFTQSTMRHIRGNVIFPATWNPLRGWEEERSLFDGGDDIDYSRVTNIEDITVLRRHIRHISMEKNLDNHSPVRQYCSTGVGVTALISPVHRNLSTPGSISNTSMMSTVSGRRLRMWEMPATPSRITLVTPSMTMTATLPGAVADTEESYGSSDIIGDMEDRPNILVVREHANCINEHTVENTVENTTGSRDSLAEVNSSIYPVVVPNQDMCTVCLDKFEDCVEVRTLRCGHIFHRACIDPWLLDHGTCPLCKMMIVPSSSSEVALALRQRAERTVHASSPLNTRDNNLIDRPDSNSNSDRNSDRHLWDRLDSQDHPDPQVLNDVAVLEWARRALGITTARPPRDSSTDVRLDLALERMFLWGAGALQTPALQHLRERHAHGSRRATVPTGGDGTVDVDDARAVDEANALLDDAEAMWVQEALAWREEVVYRRDDDDDTAVRFAGSDGVSINSTTIDGRVIAPQRDASDAANGIASNITPVLPMDNARNDHLAGFSLELMMPQSSTPIPELSQSRRQVVPAAAADTLSVGIL